MTHTAALTFFSRHCSYAVVTPKLIPVKLQMPRACVSTTQEMYHQRSPGITGVRAVPRCSAGWDSACRLPGSGCVQGAGGFPPPGASLLAGARAERLLLPRGTNLEWVPLKLVGAGGFAQGSGEAEFIYPPLSTCFLTSAALL